MEVQLSFKELTMARAEHTMGLFPPAVTGKDSGSRAAEGLEVDTVPFVTLAGDLAEGASPSWETAWIDLGGEG
jgi:hypothetical protein